MLIEIYVFYELIIIALFLLAFFTKQEIIWAITAVLSGVLMFSSYNVQTYVYVYNATITAYEPALQTNHYIYLSWINMIFFVLSMVLGIFDIFDKYGTGFLRRKKNKDSDTAREV
jgi:hypothetical protein